MTHEFYVGDKIAAFRKSTNEFINIGIIIGIHKDGIDITWHRPDLGAIYYLDKERVDRLFNNQDGGVYWKLLPDAIEKLDDIL